MTMKYYRHARRLASLHSHGQWKPSGQGSSLDSLRTVEFRQTLRGYHIDDVDEYLARAAVDAEALQDRRAKAGDD